MNLLLWDLDFAKIKFCQILKVNVPFFQCKQCFLHLAKIWRKADILIFFLVRFLYKNKLYVLLMVILYKNLCKKVILSGNIFFFLQIILRLSLRFKIENIVSPKSFVIFSFLLLHDIKGTYSIYFWSSISKADISSVIQKSTTWWSFPWIVNTFNAWNKSLYLK